MDEIWRQFGQWRQDESTLMQPWVGHARIILVDHLVTKEQQVQIERARCIAKAAGTAKARFNVQQRLDQLRCCQAGLQSNHRVQEKRLVRVTNRNCFVQGGNTGYFVQFT